MGALELASAKPSLALLILGAVCAAGLTFALSLVVVRLCRRWGLLGRAEAGRAAPPSVPRLGGLAIFASFLVVSALFVRPANPYELHVYAGFLVAAVLIIGVTAIDDVRGLSPWLRLAVQTLAALIAMFPLAHGTLIEVIHNPLASSGQGQIFLPLWIAIPFTWFWIVGMMNTINWVDGADGLAGGVVAITALVMAAISWMLGQHTAAFLCAALAGATLGFLPLNWHPARLFMGDCGAMFLGLALAMLANVGGAKLAMMMLLLGIPILDMGRVIMYRLRRGRSPLRHDSSHLHQRLAKLGLSQRQIALLYYSLTAAFGLVTIIAANLQRHASGWSLRTRLLPQIEIAATELPTLLGLALVVGVSIVIWRVVAYRRRRRGLPPGASSAGKMPTPPRLSPSASGARRRP
ncbi:MAG: Undecaprenyl-phosphate N-acetylglucosaminyl 1-phosphate transferase [Ktedonobacterales bacterium]|jgi:UDP-GlcNAc:undecaprenyl-phosphate GlcNAc-1-phosphate transferase|nr:MAG: Undecaprenyl-phosphate N-acetylglucosaminyl 1-phosphate transferase [Ktedonobacterales bacterium]